MPGLVDEDTRLNPSAMVIEVHMRSTADRQKSTARVPKRRRVSASVSAMVLKTVGRPTIGTANLNDGTFRDRYRLSGQASSIGTAFENGGAEVRFAFDNFAARGGAENEFVSRLSPFNIAAAQPFPRTVVSKKGEFGRLRLEYESLS